MINISLENIYSSKFLLDFISRTSTMSWFHPISNTIGNFKKVIDQKKFSSHKRNVLTQVISEQYLTTGLPVPKNLNLLTESNSFTVTTGHQLCLFGGPQFFIHKIISTISLAEKLKKSYPKYNFIPTFWMATEDHDFDEVSSVFLFDKEIKVNGINTNPVGRIKTEYFLSALRELKDLFKNDSRGNQLISIFEKAFSMKYWSDCTRFWVDQLFREYGLIVIDADSKDFKNLFKKTIALEVNKQFVQKCVIKSNKEITNAGYIPKINPRLLNLFFLNNNSRDRIVVENGRYFVGGQNHSKKEILQMIEQNPENFSPNVLLRPLYQECILPNLAYVGGPAEVEYWSQLKDAFEYAKIDYPFVVLRNSFAWIKKKDLEWWRTNHLADNDLFVDYNQLSKKIVLKNKNISFDVSNELNSIRNKIAQIILENDSSLDKMLESELRKFENALEKIQSKLVKSSKNKDELFFTKIKKIQNSIIKNGMLVERKNSFVPLFCEMGEQYIKQLLNASEIFSSELKILSH